MYKTPFVGATTLHGLANTLDYMRHPDMSQVASAGAERIAALEALLDRVASLELPDGNCETPSITLMMDIRAALGQEPK